jgi:hypothetical protein
VKDTPTPQVAESWFMATATRFLISVRHLRIPMELLRQFSHRMSSRCLESQTMPLTTQ